jgi:spermidine synthase
MAAMHEAPHRVLVIGLSGGAWLSVLLGVPGVEVVDVVEINPAFADLIQERPAVAPVLRDSRVRVHYDDGRRWLRSRPKGDRYDLVLMNTTFYWRNYAANLLSVEFLTQIRGHLAPGGAIFYNSTGSLHALAAAQSVFRHAYLFGNFIAASDSDLSERRARLEDRVWQTQALGRQPFDRDDARDLAAVNLVKSEPLRPAAELLTKSPAAVVPVTDMNLNTEYRYGRPLLELRNP